MSSSSASFISYLSGNVSGANQVGCLMRFSLCALPLLYGESHDEITTIAVVGTVVVRCQCPEMLSPKIIKYPG